MLLDALPHQGAGLHGFTPQQDLRLLAVLSQPAASIELETLWQVCSSLQRLGYPTVVLDGTALESDHAPGLEHLLGGIPLPGGAAASDALAVVPAARGLALLSGHLGGPAAALQHLHPLFRAYALVVLYAPAQHVAPLVRGSACVPLVMTGPGAQGLVRSYQQLKHMALHAGVGCTVASIVPPQAPDCASQTSEALGTLRASALTHLGMRIHTTTVAAARAQDIQRLALQLLENAGTIDAAMPLQPAAHPQRSH